MLVHCVQHRKLCTPKLSKRGAVRIKSLIGRPGEALIVELARCWAHLLGPRDVLARMGGDEFVISVDDADETDATIIADRILQSLEAPIHLGEHSFAVSASIGISLTPPAPADRDGAVQLQQADAAMSFAKSQGPGRIVVFAADLAAQIRNRLELFTELKQALLRDELQLKYQPVVDLATGHLLGVEALCRWTHAERGVINPDEFTPIAEAGGLIDPLDRWVLHRACRDAHAMRAAGTLPARPTWRSTSPPASSHGPTSKARSAQHSPKATCPHERSSLRSPKAP
jgi:predicted signal transduction protein with EAL and GGDEF domain